MSDYQTRPAGSPYPAPNSSMALIALISGILGLTFLPIIGSIVAVITGPMAKKEILESGGALGGEGLATAGQILGWIGIGMAVVGLCLGGIALGIPLCLAAFAISAEGLDFILPTLLFSLF